MMSGIKRWTAWLGTAVLFVFMLSGCSLAENADARESAARREAPVDPPSAKSLNELIGILGDDRLFTEREVNCMSQEFLFACLYTCDPESAAALFEERDCAKIAALLNDRFFSMVGIKPIEYHIAVHMEYDLTGEMRRQVQDFFMQNYQQVAAQYGEYYAQKVKEENEGQQKLAFPVYTTTDTDGHIANGPDGLSGGLMFAVTNGRYYWADFSLFQSIAGNP